MLLKASQAFLDGVSGNQIGILITLDPAPRDISSESTTLEQTATYL